MSRRKIIVRNLLIGLDAESDAAVRRNTKTMGQTESQFVRDAIQGLQRFCPTVEAWIEQRMASTGMTRAEVIHSQLYAIAQHAWPSKAPTLPQAPENRPYTLTPTLGSLSTTPPAPVKENRHKKPRISPGI